MNIGFAKGLLLAPAVLLTASAGCARPLPAGASVNAENVKTLQTAFQAGKSAAGGAEAVAAEPTGWATFKGSFKLTGAPAPDKLVVDKDTAVCAPGGKTVLSEKIRVDSEGNLRDVVIYLATPFKAGDPKWEHESYLAKKDEQPEFDQKDCIFLSHMFVMRSSQVLKILNSDPVGHNTKLDGNGKAKPDNITISANGSQTYSPGGQSDQPFGVACSIHPWMSANMLVRDNGLTAVSKPDGTFEIANIPAGVPLEFKVWHEAFKFLKGPVTLNGKPAKFGGGGKLAFKAEPGDTIELVFEAAAP